MAQHTFYKGNKFLYYEVDIVLQDYINGIYKTKLGETVSLGTKINKYNIGFLGEVKELTDAFYGLIVAEHIAIKLMNLNSNVVQGEVRNLWNLIKAQSGTMRFNKSLINGLKKYGIDKQRIYDILQKSIEKQKERILRNKKLLKELLKDYGLGQLIEIVEKETNLDLVAHIVAYTEEVGLELKIGAQDFDNSEESRKQYYDAIENKYIDYLRGVATKYNLNFDNEISKSLLQHREIVDKRIQEGKDRAKEQKKEARLNNASNVMSDDNVMIQRDIVSGCYDEKKRLGLYKATQVHSRIVSLGGCVWYIACARKTRVSYINEKCGFTTDLMKTKFFTSLDDAKNFYNNLSEYIDEKEYTSNIFKILKLYAVGNVTKEVDSKKSFIESELSQLEVSNAIEKNLIRRIIYMCNGVNTDNSRATFVCYVAKKKESKTTEIEFISVTNDKIELDKRFYLMTPYTVQFAKEQELLKFFQNKLGNEYIVDEYVLTLDSAWYKSVIENMYSEYNAFREFLQGVPIKSIKEKYPSVNYKKGMFNASLNVVARENYKYKKNRSYIIMITNGFSICYYGNRTLLTQTYFAAEHFDSLDRARDMCLSLVDKKYKELSGSTIFKIFEV